MRTIFTCKEATARCHLVSALDRIWIGSGSGLVSRSSLGFKDFTLSSQGLFVQKCSSSVPDPPFDQNNRSKKKHLISSEAVI